MYFIFSLQALLNRSTRRKTSLSKDEKQQQTQPTLVGGECSHHCAIPAHLHEMGKIAEYTTCYLTRPCTLKILHLPKEGAKEQSRNKQKCE